MKPKPFIACLAALAAGVAVVTLNAQEEADPASEKAQPQQWEHMALPRDAAEPLSDPEFARQINGLGDKGWELLNVVNFTKEGNTTRSVYYFKRPKG